MPYITREDGEHFVIPSYRDVLTVRQKNQLKKEVLLLSKSYGDYITLQKKNNTQYEVAFSPDTGYLLGESIWHYFKKPLDMIYCEAIPNTTEAILVIVKAGSVYLDGSFPLDSIPEELIIFLTQQNNFEIYTYGEVPISKEPVADKFSFDTNSVKSFTVLDKPVFPVVPLLKIYQLKLVDTVLKEQGIGVLPIRQIVMVIAFLGLGYLAYSWLTSAPPPPPPTVEVVDPYQAYYEKLTSPAPENEIYSIDQTVNQLMQISGWRLTEVDYQGGTVVAKVLSNGGTMADLYAFADANKLTVMIQENGISLIKSLNSVNRPRTHTIYSAQKVLAAIIDRVGTIVPGNNMTLGSSVKTGVFLTAPLTIALDKISTPVLNLIGQQFAGLPVVLNTVQIAIDNGTITGTIKLDVVGN